MPHVQKEGQRFDWIPRNILDMHWKDYKYLHIIFWMPKATFKFGHYDKHDFLIAKVLMTHQAIGKWLCLSAIQCTNYWQWENTASECQYLIGTHRLNASFKISVFVWMPLPNVYPPQFTLPAFFACGILLLSGWEGAPDLCLVWRSKDGSSAG